MSEARRFSYFKEYAVGSKIRQQSCLALLKADMKQSKLRSSEIKRISERSEPRFFELD